MNKNSDKNEVVETANTAPGTALSIDWELYGTYLEDSDLSEAQKREFIETLWSIVVSFVDLGFGIHPLQQALPDGCEQLPDLIEILASDPGHVISSKNQLTKTEFSKVAGHEHHGRGGGDES